MKTHKYWVWLWTAATVALLFTSRALGQAGAEKAQFTGTEAFTGIFIDFGRSICPGHEPTGGFPPCPQGSRTEVRGLVRIYQDTFNDSRVSGTNVVTENWNFDENFVGPMWGTFRLVVNSQEVWEGIWTGHWRGSSGSLRLVGHGSGGRVDGLQISYQCEYTSGAGGPCVGRIIDQKPQ